MTDVAMTVVAIGSVTTGLLGFLVVLVLVIACVFLFRSMAKHLRKVPASFDDPPPPDDRSPDRRE
jgi:hypothetical protein